MERNLSRLTKRELVEEIEKLRRRVIELEAPPGPRSSLEAAEQLAFLQVLIDTVPTPIFYKDIKHVYLGCNSAFEEFIGFEKSEIIGRGVYDVAPSDLADVYRAADEELFARGGAQVYETQVMAADGTRHDVIFHKAVFNEADGIPGGLIGIIVDISERKRFEKALLDSKEKAEFADRAKTEFLANMSHELRTPLNSVLGFSDVLRNESFGPLGDPRYRDYAEYINASGVHLLALISDILDVSKIEAGELSLDVEVVEIRPLVRDCRNMVGERAAKAEIALSTSIAPNVDRVEVDPLRLKQIFLNLLSNAIRFTPSGGKVSLEIDTDSDGMVRMIVADTGVGIPAEDLPRVVEPFVQVTSDPKHDRSGSGLGLSLANSLAELHGGDLSIESRRGRGTRVTVRVPRRRAQDG